MCVLHVTSETTSFAAFLRDTEFPAYQSHEKGEVSRIGKRQPYEDYGFSSNVSERDWSSLTGQMEDAIVFLRTHDQTLGKLLSSHDVTDIRLDFPYSCRLDEQIFMQCDYLPPEFLLLVGELGIGIELSHYPPCEEDSEHANPKGRPKGRP
jgi:hypothetical protein